MVRRRRGHRSVTEMVVIIGALLVTAIATATVAATGAAVSNATECLSSLEVVGLDNCPELQSGEGVGSNSIVAKLLAAKADMLRQVIGVLSDPASAGEGGNLDEPLLLVKKLALDETDAVFGSSEDIYLGHAAHAGTWGSSAGGFNRWVETYYRKVLGGTRPVLVTVTGDNVCALEKELSLEARRKAAYIEDMRDLSGDEPSAEAADVDSDDDGENRAGKISFRSNFDQATEDFEVPVVLMTLGWDPSGDPTHRNRDRDVSCALRVLEMSRVVRWITSHTRRDSHTHEKFRYVPIGFGGFETRSGLPQTAYLDAAKRQLEILDTCPIDEAGSYDLLFQCSNLSGPRAGIWEEMTEGKGLGSPIPVNRFPLDPTDMVTAAARGIFAVSPPGTGPDCFRHYEMVLEGNIALVPDEPSLRTFMDGLPVFFFGGEDGDWGSLTCSHLLEMAETVQAKIMEGKEGGGGLQLEKLTHGFWRRYIRREVLRAGGVTDEDAVYVERSPTIMR